MQGWTMSQPPCALASHLRDLDKAIVLAIYAVWGCHSHCPLDSPVPALTSHCSLLRWPPTSCELNLERCARVLPQDNDTGGFFIALIHKGPASSKISTPNAPSQAVVASDLVPMSSLSKAHAKAVLAKHCLPPEKNVRRGLTSSERGRLWCSGGNGEAGGSEALVMVAPQDMLEHDECLGRRSWRGVVQAGLPLAEAVLLQQSSKGL